MAKKHISLWMDEDVLNKCDANIKIAKVKNRSEFFETAVDFYNGFVIGFVEYKIISADDKAVICIKRHLGR